MLCRGARRAIADRSALRLEPGRAAALEAHLVGCEGCGTEAAVERRLAEDLAALRVEVPFAVDAVPAVMARLADAAPASRAEVPARQLGWGSAAAVAGGLLLLATWDNVLPALIHLWRDLAELVLALWDPLLQLLRPLAGLVLLPLKFVVALVEARPPIGGVLARLEPVGAITLAACYAAMAATIAVVLGRDLRARRLRRPR